MTAGGNRSILPERSALRSEPVIMRIINMRITLRWRWILLVLPLIGIGAWFTLRGAEPPPRSHWAI